VVDVRNGKPSLQDSIFLLIIGWPIALALGQSRTKVGPVLPFTGFALSLFSNRLVNMAEDIIPSETLLDKGKSYVDKNVVRLKTLSKLLQFIKSGFKIVLLLGSIVLCLF